MRVFLDTNILIDAICSREGYVENANHLFALALEGKITILISSHSFVTAYYVGRRNKFDERELLSALKSVGELCEVASVGKSDLARAMDAGWRDFEDAVQNAVAVRNGADCIVTRNVADFASSEMPVMTPSDFLEMKNDK